MSHPANLLEFYDDGRVKREKESFQGYLFKNLDFRNAIRTISFMRSDFRGAKIVDCHFMKNNFSNADFIDSSILRSTFDESAFRSTEFYNSYFENVTFKDIKFLSASFVKIVFLNSNFSGLKFGANTVQGSAFIGCKISDCDFKKSSMDDVEFKDTSIKDTDLSSMTALNLFFENCKFENVIIDADYIGSYSFKGRFLENIKLKYRGRIFDLDITQKELLDNLFKIFFEKERYYECLNILVQKNLLENKTNSLFSIIKVIVGRLLADTNTLKRTYQLERIFKILEYYINTDYIALSDYFKTIGYMESLDYSLLSFMERLGYQEKINRLKALLETSEIEKPIIDKINYLDKVFMEITIDENNEKIFEEYFSKSTLAIMQNYAMNEDMCEPYEIIGKRKGSIVYEIVIYSSVALILLRLLKSIVKEAREIFNETMQFGIDYKLNIRVINYTNRLKNKDTISEAHEIRKLQSAPKGCSDNTIEMNNIQKLLPLIKSAIVYPNALSNMKD